jgi:hypothetical protein
LIEKVEASQCWHLMAKQKKEVIDGVNASENTLMGAIQSK